MDFIRILIVFLLSFLICINNAFALRPVVTTDAYVADKGKLEFKLGYFGIKEEKNPGIDELTIEFPRIHLHYGLLRDIEFTVETVGEFVDDRQKGDFELREQQFSDTAVLLKKVWHRRDRIIPSFATEAGVLFPIEKGGERIDFKGVSIFTWEFKDIAFHTTNRRYYREKEKGREA